MTSGVLAQPRGCILPSQLLILKVQVLQWDFHLSFWFSCQLLSECWTPDRALTTCLSISHSYSDTQTMLLSSDTGWASGSNPVDPSGTTITVPLINTSIIWEVIIIITSLLRCGPQLRLTLNCQHYFKPYCWKRWPGQQNLFKLLSYPSLPFLISTTLFFFSYWLIHAWQEEKIGIE